MMDEDMVWLQQQEIKALKAQLAECQKDAERYRWLRDTGDETYTPFCAKWDMRSGDVDKIIDAAMKEQSYD